MSQPDSATQLAELSTKFAEFSKTVLARFDASDASVKDLSSKVEAADNATAALAKKFTRAEKKFSAAETEKDPDGDDDDDTDPKKDPDKDGDKFAQIEESMEQLSAQLAALGKTRKFSKDRPSTAPADTSRDRGNGANKTHPFVAAVAEVMTARKLSKADALMAVMREQGALHTSFLGAGEPAQLQLKSLG